MATDIEKYCTNKRLKKNLYKIDFHHLGQKYQDNYPSNIQYSDPIIEYQFKIKHSNNWQSLMKEH